MLTVEQRIALVPTMNQGQLLELWQDILLEYATLRKEEGAFSALKIGTGARLMKEAEDGKYPSESLIDRALVQEFGSGIVEGHKQQWHRLQFIVAALEYISAVDRMVRGSIGLHDGQVSIKQAE